MILDSTQLNAISKMRNGVILCGGTGSGKSRTGLGYYCVVNGLDLGKKFPAFRAHDVMPLYIITAAKKRDDLEWEKEFILFGIEPDDVTIDSWQNIKKYSDVSGAFFIFDEQHASGKGVWAKSFLQIAKSNKWIMLSATPGDCWENYIPVFIANGFYKNRSEFAREHIIYKWNRKANYPQIERYVNEGKLIRLRKSILVDLPTPRHTKQNHHDILVDYDVEKYKQTFKTRQNQETKEPFKNVSELCIYLRRVVNSDYSRVGKVLDILKDHPRALIFYNYNFELELLKSAIPSDIYEIAEYNGHKHQQIPKAARWVYLVHYEAGKEAWNCLTTDTVIFYSLNYSYRTMIQASGRIDRRDSIFSDLHYYHLVSKAPIDRAIQATLRKKEKFNETMFIKEFEKGGYLWDQKNLYNSTNTAGTASTETSLKTTILAKNA